MLLKIIDLQNEIILLLKKSTEKSLHQVTVSSADINFTTSTQDLCSDGKYHQYPNPWFSTMPPDCLKCGKTSSFPFVTYTTASNLDEHGVCCGV